MRNEIEKVLEAMREDYKRWSYWSSSYKPNAHSDKKIMNEMIDKVEKHHFNDLIKKDKFNIQNYKIGDLDSVEESSDEFKECQRSNFLKKYD